MVNHVLTLLIFAVAVSSSFCAKLTRPDRNYYPMQRVIWTVLGFVYGGSGLARLVQPATQPPGRVAISTAFSVAILLATSYSIWFMRRRNQTPRFIPIDAGGQPRVVSQLALRADFDRTISYLRHGAMPGDWVAELDEAREDWQKFETWRQELARESEERRKRRRGIE